MKKKKSMNILVLKKMMSFTLTLTLVLGLVTAADVFYPTQENIAKAASFETSGGGVTAPAFNAANFPVLNTTCSTMYYFGKEGNAFYGVGTDSNVWELVDTDSKMNGTVLRSAWGSGTDTNGQVILDFTNNLASSHFNAADKNAMGTKNVDTKDYNPSGTGSLTGAFMWPLSYTQLNANKRLGGYLYHNVDGHLCWTRSYSGGVHAGNPSARAVCGGGGDIDARSVTDSNWVAPAFNLDMSRVLIARSANSAFDSQTLSPVGIASGDLKFLINAGSHKSSFNVASINGKTLSNVFAGKTYSFDYTGASTEQINSGKNYISAILYDSSGRIAYYGNLGTVSAASGKANITIPEGLTGTYTMAVFEEEKCAANKTDYASEPVYSKFTILTRNYETKAEISSTQDSSVEVGSVISNSNFSANVTYVDGSKSTEKVYLISSADFEKTADKRTIKSTTVTVPNGSSTFKVTAVFVPQYTDEQSYWSKEFTYNINYENSTSFHTTHGSSFSLNDTINSSEFGGEITWLNGSKTSVPADDIYIVPVNVWGSGMSKENLTELSKYNGGKSVKIDSSELNGAQSYGIVAVYFPKVAGAAMFHTQSFEFASATLYPTAFKASYGGKAAEFGDLLTDSDFSGRYVLSDGDKTEVEAPVKYILPTETWNNLSADIKASEARLKKVKGVNSTVIPSESDLKGTEDYSITVVYYDYSEQHSYGGGTNAGDCNYYSQEVKVPLDSAVIKDYKSYTALGITWYYQLDEDNNAVNVHTVNEDINQVIDKNGVLNIPAEIDGYVVKSIGTGSKARPFIPENVNSYTSIKFPDTLTEVNDYAFYANTAFARIVIPSTVSKIGNFAFYDFDNLTSVKIESASVGAAAFGNCDGLIEVSVNGVSSIGKVAFAECANLTKLTVSGNTGIGKSAFANDSKINAVNLKNLSGSKIEAYAFKDCVSVKEVYVPASNKVEAHAFDGCSGITNLELDISTVENNSFEGCCNVRYLVFGKNVSNVEYNWGGYSLDTYESNDTYTEVLDTIIYVKNRDTKFETYRDGNEFYSSFMGHYVPSGSYKYSRKVSVYMPKEASTGHSVEGTLVGAVANYYQTAQDDKAEGDNTYKKYYTANGLLSVSFEADENIDDKTINLPSVRDGITAYYDGKVYDNARADKEKVIVNPIYSDAAAATESLKDFNFYTASEADAAIREWIKSTDYSYKNVISGKLEADKEYTYSQYLQYVETNTITGDDLETERLAMIQSIFEDKSLFLTATDGIMDNPTIYEVNSNQNYAIQHMNVIYYPDEDISKDKDYTENEPVYYITTIDVKVVKYTDEMYFFDQGFTYETVVKEIKELQDKIAALTSDVERLEKANNELADQNNSYSNKLAECRQQLDQYITMYNRLIQELNDYIGSTDVDDNGYFGTKTEANDKGEEVVIKVVWVNGTECRYEKTDEQKVVDGITYDIYSGTGDIDGDGIPDNFKFYVASDGVHVIEKNGEEVNELYSDPIRALERKLTAQLTAIRNQLSGISEKIDKLRAALGIEDENFDNFSPEEQLAIILEKVNELLEEKGGLESKLHENNMTLNEYEDAMESIYRQLVSGTLDETDVSTIQKKLGKILDTIKNIQGENMGLTEKCSSLEAEIERLKEKYKGNDEELQKQIEKFESDIAGYKKTISNQTDTIKELSDSVKSYVLTVDDAAELFGTSRNASAAEVKASINAFIRAKVENENTIKAIQKKLNTNATGDALVALVGVGTGQNPTPAPTEKNNTDVVSKAAYEELQTANKNMSSENSELSEKVGALTSELERVKAENIKLSGQNKENGELISALGEKNQTLAGENKTLKDTNTALGKKVMSLTDKNKTLKAKNDDLKAKASSANTSGRTTTVTRTVYVTPSPTMAPIRGNTNTAPSNGKKAMITAKPKKTEAPAKATKAPLNTAGISSELVPVKSSSDGMNTYGTVITIELPIGGSNEDLEGAAVTGLDRDCSYAGVLTSNGSRDSESTGEAKDNANAIFSYYAGHLEELANLGSKEIKENIGDSSKIISISAIGSIDVTPSALQSEAMENGEKFSLNLSSNEFTNGNMYLVVHESEKRDGKYDVALVLAQNGSIDIELEDLSPVAVAEVGIKDLSSFDEGEAPSGESVDEQSHSNGNFKIIFIILGLIFIAGIGVLVHMMKKQKRDGSLRRRN